MTWLVSLGAKLKLWALAAAGAIIALGEQPLGTFNLPMGWNLA